MFKILTLVLFEKKKRELSRVSILHFTFSGAEPPQARLHTTWGIGLGAALIRLSCHGRSTVDVLGTSSPWYASTGQGPHVAVGWPWYMSRRDGVVA
jgi:hypothetical protein